MYTASLRRPRAARSSLFAYVAQAGLPALIRLALVSCMGLVAPFGASAQQLAQSPVVHRVQGANERLELIVHTSRILTLGQKIPRAQVNNPDIIELTPLSATQVQILAKKPGVTQVNLWNEQDEVHAIDVIVYGDAQELAMLLRSQFPKASLKVVPLSNSVLISGYVDDPNQVNRIVQMAEDYHPKVINNITVGGVQQVLLQVRLMEVSRTKLRTAGFDWGNISSRGDVAAQGVSGLLRSAAGGTGGSVPGVAYGASNSVGSIGGTAAFGVLDSGNSFFGVLDLLQQRNVAKILAEPNLVTVSGRPASFDVGGEFPILVPQSLGTVSIQYRKFGTQVDFVPIVLGNGAIRLEVRPRVSEIDDTRSITINGTTVPGLKVREVDTGVEMRAGQTLALAGLVQMRSDAVMRGIPWLSDIPIAGAAFRRVSEQTNEIELLILVTPQLVEAMDPEDVPPCGPGLSTQSPTDCQLYGRGHIEVPLCGPSPAAGVGGYGGHSGGFGGQGELIETQSYEQVTPLPDPRVNAASPDQSARRRSSRRDATPASTRRPAPNPNRLRQVERRPDDRLHSQNRYETTERLPATAPSRQKKQPGFIGPIGYDVSN